MYNRPTVVSNISIYNDTCDYGKTKFTSIVTKTRYNGCIPNQLSGQRLDNTRNRPDCPDKQMKKNAS